VPFGCVSSALHTGKPAVEHRGHPCYGHTELVQLLLENGASTVINTAVMECHRDCGKVTPLMSSTVIPITKLLLAAGADVHAVTSNGDTCLHIAAKHRYPASLLCLMLQAGANISAKNKQGRTAAQMQW
jgi:uncharacterized protein